MKCEIHKTAYTQVFITCTNYDTRIILEETQIRYTVIHDEAQYSSSINCSITELRNEGQLIFYKEQPNRLRSS